MKTWLAMAAVAALAWAGGALADTGGQPPCSTALCADVDGNGSVNIIDIAIVAANFDETTEGNPCVEYAQPSEPVLVWGTMTDAAGPLFLVPGDHPAYQPLKEGTPWPLRVCQ